MYRRLPDPDLVSDAADSARRPLAVTIDGQPHMARAGDSVAATLLAAGFAACRTTPVTGSARGPFCMMGVCFDCLVVIDGRPNQQACMIPARDGMRIERQQGAPTVAVGDDPAAPDGRA
jgi:predicted molibdopterin-dependent oxidoreductase YjgC